MVNQYETLKPWRCGVLGASSGKGNGARKVGSASVELELPSGLEKALPKSRKLSSFLDVAEGLKKLSWSRPSPEEELLPKNDPPELSSVLNSGASPKEKKSAPPSRWEESDLWSSAPEVLKKLAIITFSEE